MRDGRRVILAAIGDATHPRTWSGTPYHLLEAGRALGVLTEGLALRAEGPDWMLRRVGWNLWRVATGRGRGGYQYSRGFLERYWRPALPRVAGQVVLNCYQLYAPSVVEDPSVERWFFIDATIGQLLNDYGNRRLIGAAMAREVTDRERDGYLAATGIIAHSSWAATSVVRDYSVPPERVHVVVPGAGIEHARYLAWEQRQASRRATTTGRREMRLVFVGVDWRRKGLDRLLRALAIARRAGAAITLRVLGSSRDSVPPALRETPGVEWVGFIDKRREADRFLDLVGEADIGCLLSRAEAGGIAYREYHAMGLGVIGTKVGGSPEHMVPGGAIMLAPDAPDAELAELLVALANDPDRREALRRTSWEQRHSVLNHATARQLGQVMGVAAEVRQGVVQCAG